MRHAMNVAWRAVLRQKHTTFAVTTYPFAMSDVMLSWKLRPYPISSRRSVPPEIEKPDWAIGHPNIEINSDLQNKVEIKTPEQIERMRETCRDDYIDPGNETLFEKRSILKTGICGYPSPLNYHFFPSLAARRSVNEVICHGIPDATNTYVCCRRLEDGDIVNVDVTVCYKGVHGDLNETYFVGKVDEASQQLVKCTYECLEKAISIVKPGVRFERLERVFFVGVWHDRMWPDGWTAVTADGKHSAQFEHTLLVIFS
ncbi:hypothetical protein GIB67_039606 [Kingdonia uniflora]|uniref:Peptidase M24 domain-containing protein n=1 Tax=Kingdonia uniflora TaxID=39325 RepID=A0A7J7LV18_9MAGN|nr:hypothetical protein GIB67_039606 [Kingdonia uniflora]